MPDLDALPDALELSVILKAGDDVSTDEILPAGTEILPLRSNIAAISEFAFAGLDKNFAEKARKAGGDGLIVIGGENYGQGSSREHAALAPRYLGLRAVIAKSFARIHRQNLINFGIIPLLFDASEDYDRLETGKTARLEGLEDAINSDNTLKAEIGGADVTCRLDLSGRERAMLAKGGAVNYLKSGA